MDRHLNLKKEFMKRHTDYTVKLTEGKYLNKYVDELESAYEKFYDWLHEMIEVFYEYLNIKKKDINNYSKKLYDELMSKYEFIEYYQDGMGNYICKCKNGKVFFFDHEDLNSLTNPDEITEREAKEIFNEDSLNEVYPVKGESKKDFISRFMKETKGEYPDIKQRYAVANSYWNRRNKKKKVLIEDSTFDMNKFISLLESEIFD